MITLPSYTDILNIFKANLDDSLPPLFTDSLGKALSGLFITLFKRSGELQKQLFILTASDDEFTIGSSTYRPLRLWGALVGIPAPNNGVRSELLIDIDATAAATIYQGASFSGSNGLTYLAISDFALVSGTNQITIRCVDEGLQGNLAAQDSMTLDNAIDGVDSNAAVNSVSINGTDSESVASYRQRIIARFRNPPRGGAAADYVYWAYSNPDVALTDVRPYTNANPRYYNIYIDTAAGGATSEERALVRSHLIPLVPDGVLPLVNSVTRKTLNVRITGLEATPDETSVKAAIVEGLTAFFESRSPYIPAVDSVRRDSITVAAVSSVAQDIAAARGSAIVDCVLLDDTTSIQLYILGEGEKSQLGTVTWVSA